MVFPFFNLFGGACERGGASGKGTSEKVASGIGASGTWASGTGASGSPIWWPRNQKQLQVKQVAFNLQLFWFRGHQAPLYGFLELARSCLSGGYSARRV